MNYNKYMTVETTFMDDCPCFSFQSNKDIQNGAIVGRGVLISGEEMVYEATDDYSNGMYLVANPAWNYDRHKADSRNEESFINKAGIPFRVYELKKNRYFTVGNLPKDVTLAVGDFVEFNTLKSGLIFTPRFINPNSAIVEAIFCASFFDFEESL